MINKNTRLAIYLPIAFSLVMVIGMFLGARLMRSGSGTQPVVLSLGGSQYDKVSDVMQYIQDEYVDPVDGGQMDQEAIQAVIGQLDPHSQYIPAENFDEVNDLLLGNFEGIGVQFRIEKDTVTVISPVANGPSQKVGVLAGDRIVRVNDSLIAGNGVSNNDVIRLLKGKRGTTVQVDVYRRGFPDLIRFSIVRDVIPTYSVDVAYMVTGKVGYIKVSKFAATTAEEFRKALVQLKSDNMESLILDLRGNSGGYLQAAIAMADQFLKKDELVVYTEGHHRPRQLVYATGHGLFETQPVVVLIDEGSASASEIVAGAIQDNDRGLVIGRRSFGKGLVQEQMNLPDGSAVRLTVARYFTPTGRCIQRPYQNGDNEAYYQDFYQRFSNGELESADSIHFADSLKYTTPGGKVVYGGGGIMPDVFVPLGTHRDNSYYYHLLNKGLIYRFAFDYTDTHRKSLEQLVSRNDFDANFMVNDQMFDDFLAYAEANGVDRDPDGITEAAHRIRTLIKAFVARNILDDAGFYPIYHRVDDVFGKAVESLKTT